jgi:RNA polymerase sigma-70 factor (ECF subfamily)
MDLERTVEELARPLLRFSIGMTGDVALAEEAAQDALTALVARWRRKGPPESPSAFVFAIARRRGIRMCIRRRLFAPLESVPDGRSCSPDAEVSVGSRIKLRRTIEALQRLPSRDRNVLLVAASEDADLVEAARRAGVAPSAYRMRLHRARRRLRALLGETDE